LKVWSAGRDLRAGIPILFVFEVDGWLGCEGEERG
jgi:hypothetical protein